MCRNNKINILEPVKDEVTKFFKSLGYTVTWDFSNSTGKEWYEILLNNELICQIDMGVPKDVIIEDFRCWHEGKDSTSSYNYAVMTGPPNSPLFLELLEKVYTATNENNQN